MYRKGSNYFDRNICCQEHFSEWSANGFGHRLLLNKKLLFYIKQYNLCKRLLKKKVQNLENCKLMWKFALRGKCILGGNLSRREDPLSGN